MSAVGRVTPCQTNPTVTGASSVPPLVWAVKYAFRSDALRRATVLSGGPWVTESCSTKLNPGADPVARTPPAASVRSRSGTLPAAVLNHTWNSAFPLGETLAERHAIGMKRSRLVPGSASRSEWRSVMGSLALDSAYQLGLFPFLGLPSTPNTCVVQ